VLAVCADASGHGWCLNAGGDIVVASPAGHPSWRVGVEDSADPARVLRVLLASEGAVATSGSARCGEATGRPATAVRSATVIGP
jgi:thiamine biosynthesis lipoprotein